MLVFSKSVFLYLMRSLRLKVRVMEERWRGCLELFLETGSKDSQPRSNSLDVCKVVRLVAVQRPKLPAEGSCSSGKFLLS